MDAQTAVWEARLTLVQSAITALVSGGVQSYEIDGMTVTKLDLRQLTAEESRLRGMVKRASRQGGAFRVGSPL
jgi:hypothetical protein